MTHFDFIAWAYGLTAIAIVGLTFYVWANLRHQARRLAELEGKGLRRRRRAQGATET